MPLGLVELTVDDAYYLQQMKIDVWEERDRSTQPLVLLEKRVAGCSLCSLHSTRIQTVFARGSPQAKLMIVGEAPGYHEDQQGLPFVGRAGQLLDQMLKSIDLSEQDVYIANLLKCRPPNNRDPSSEEINLCKGYLIQQIELIKPQILLALGRFAGNFLTNQTQPLNRLRQRSYTYETIPCYVSYHPAYLLRNPSDKKWAYQDLLKVKGLLT